MMVGKLFKTGLLVVVLSTMFVGAVYAEEEIHPPTIRVIGEITSVSLDSSSFNFHTRNGEDLRFQVVDRTKFRSRDGSIENLGDLKPGMFALVIATRTEGDDLLALMVAVGDPSDRPAMFRASGSILSVDVANSTLSIETSRGEQIRFAVSDRTRFKSRDGSVTGLADLEPGMPVTIAGIRTDDGTPLALVVVAGQLHDRPEKIEVVGEITNVIPGQSTFDIHTVKGADLTFMVVERTTFRSPDGTLEDIHDLKAGMLAHIVGVKGEDGSLIALVVAAGERDDLPGGDHFDVRAAGKIIEIGDRTFTLQTAKQGTLTFTVDGSTKYKSRGGFVENFEDLELGMFAVVGAKELGAGQLKAVIVGVGQPAHDRDPGSQDRPRDARPERDSIETPSTSL
jgi:hypothetical protein